MNNATDKPWFEGKTREEQILGYARGLVVFYKHRHLVPAGWIGAARKIARLIEESKETK